MKFALLLHEKLCFEKWVCGPSVPPFVVMFRIGRKRTLATMNAFDLVVTVVLGDILARTILARDAALLEGMVGFVKKVEAVVVESNGRLVAIPLLVNGLASALGRNT